MRLLLDTHMLIWAASQPQRLSPAARNLLEAPENDLLFSVVSIWEISIKASLGRDDFRLDAALLRRGLLDNGYVELSITGAHAIAISALPPIHKDPFDRMLVAQAMTENLLLLTADSRLSQYPGSIRQLT